MIRIFLNNYQCLLYPKADRVTYNEPVKGFVTVFEGEKSVAVFGKDFIAGFDFKEEEE